MSEPTKVTDVTDAAPTLDPSTRSLVQKVVLAVTAAGGALLLLDAGVKKLKSEKSVKVVVADKPSTEKPSS